MTVRNTCLLIALLTAWHAPTIARADGGIVRVCEVRAGRRITVFTAPTSMRAGPQDVSVLVQDVVSGKPLLDVPIAVSAYPIADPRRKTCVPATTDATTNKLFHAAQLNLPDAGSWRVEVVADALPQEPPIGFDVVVAPPAPPWLDMSPWIAWPLLAIGLYALHQWLVQRRRPFSAQR